MTRPNILAAMSSESVVILHFISLRN